MRTQFESVLREQHLLDDLSAFADPAYFDETPLYSRYRQVDFLKRYGDENLLLIELALGYLDRVASAMQGDRIARFAAITVISDDGGKHLVPQIFVCNGDVEHRLAGLQLVEPSSVLGKQVKELVAQARPGGDFGVYDDRATVPGDVRVFVGHKSPPHGFMAVAHLAASWAEETQR
ncbi:MAG TPA: Imm15 family immunity protein [Pirellulales bacterium]|nr:Imm15 family immunity protein [Pirellulales bacterium]